MTGSTGSGFFRLLAVFALGSGAIALGQSNPIQLNIDVNAVGGGFGCCESIAGDSTTASFLPDVSTSLHIAGGAYSDGGGTGGWTFTFDFRNGDQAVFNDPNSSLGEGNSNSAVGTATLTFGSGTFLLAKGSLNYTLTCTNCANDVTGPVVFVFTFTATGVLTFPAGTMVSSQTLDPPVVQCNLPPDAMCQYKSELRIQVETSQKQQANEVLSPKAQAAGGGSLRIMPIALPYPVTYSVSAKCVNLPDTCWIAAGSSGSVNPFTSPSINVAIDIPSLAVGIYPADLAVIETPTDPSLPPVKVNVPMTLIVSAPGPALALSTTGMEFQALAGPNAATVTQSVAISNSQTGTLSYQAVASTLSGSSWLSVSSSSGSVTATPANVEISANPAGLAAGVYFGRVDFNAGGALASPQSVLVSLTVLPAPTLSTAAIPAMTPSGLLFVSTPKVAPGSQTVQLASASARTVTVTPQPI